MISPEVILIAANIILVSFGGGKLWQAVSDHSRRLDRIERKIDGNFYPDPEKTTKKK